jgi:hypothetical protein
MGASVIGRGDRRVVELALTGCLVVGIDQVSYLNKSQRLTSGRRGCWLQLLKIAAGLGSVPPVATWLAARIVLEPPSF